jgi:hypothetical protein
MYDFIDKDINLVELKAIISEDLSIYDYYFKFIIHFHLLLCTDLSIFKF